MPLDLADMHILVQAPPFFGYDEVIANALRKRGAIVDLIPDRPFDSALMHAVTKLERRAVLGHAARIYRRKLDAFGRSRYDHILVVNGQTLSESYLGTLRQDFPTAKFSFYIWDDFDNRPHAVAMLPKYDAAFSFDRRAADKYGVGFRPLFFSPDYDLPANPAADIDLSFVGTAHSDRPAVVHRINQRLPAETSRFWFLYLKARWVLYYNRLTSRHFRSLPSSLFSYSPLPRPEVKAVFARSKGFLDIEHERQSGLTIRTFEALGSRKKLVTTNPRVREFDFYVPENIQVINRADPKIDLNLLMSPIKEVTSNIRHRYSVQGWIDDILGKGDQP
jgi:hypothetical protein